MKTAIETQRDAERERLERVTRKPHIAELLNNFTPDENPHLTEQDIVAVLLEGDPLTSEPVVVIVLSEDALTNWTCSAKTYWPVLNDAGYLYSVIYSVEDFKEYYPNEYEEWSCQNG